MPPRARLELELVALWEELLGVGPIGVEDDFFALGGNSLLATRLVARLRSGHAVKLTVSSVFEHPTVAGLAGYLRGLLSEGRREQPIAAVQRSGQLPLSLAQRRLWFLEQLSPDSGAYNVPVAMRLHGRVDHAVLARCLDELVARHEPLRTSFAAVDGEPVQRVQRAEPVTLALDDLRRLPASARERRARALVDQEAQTPFDLEVTPLLRVRLVRLDAEEHLLVLTVHHLAIDGWSLPIVFAELDALYQAFSAGRPSPCLR